VYYCSHAHRIAWRSADIRPEEPFILKRSFEALTEMTDVSTRAAQITEEKNIRALNLDQRYHSF
jgi:hypothetical protein